MKVAIIGGTGKEGQGMAARWAKAGHTVFIGSRTAERAVEAAAELGKKAGVKTLVLSHVTEQIDQPGVRERVLNEMSQVYKGNLVLGEDRLEVPVKKAAVPAKLL